MDDDFVERDARIFSVKFSYAFIQARVHRLSDRCLLAWSFPVPCHGRVAKVPGVLRDAHAFEIRPAHGGSHRLLSRLIVPANVIPTKFRLKFDLTFICIIVNP